MKLIKVCEYSRSRSFHYDLILKDQASGERSQDQWSSGLILLIGPRRYFCGGSYCLLSRCYKFLCCLLYMYVFIYSLNLGN